VQYTMTIQSLALFVQSLCENRKVFAQALMSRWTSGGETVPPDGVWRPKGDNVVPRSCHLANGCCHVLGAGSLFGSALAASHRLVCRHWTRKRVHAKYPGAAPVLCTAPNR